MKVFHKKYVCPKCKWKYGQTEEVKDLIIQICAGCSWGNKY